MKILFKRLIHLRGLKSRVTSIPLAALLLSIMSVGCTMVTSDLEPCAPEPNTLTTVNFVYDYNMQFTDLLSDHVGSIYLYIFDSQGIYRIRREAHRGDMIGPVDFSMTFDTTEIKPGHTYQFVAVAQANHIGLEASQATPGFTLQTEMVPGVSKIDDYILKLDRNNDGEYDFGIVDYRDVYGNTETMIDTIWSTRPDEVQIVSIPKTDYIPTLKPQEDRHVDVTVPMMRITNSIKTRFIGSIFNADTSVDDYHVIVNFPHGNGTIDFTGNLQPAQQLIYRALRKKLFEINQTRATAYGIEADFGVSRLHVNDESRLQILDASNYNVIAEIPDFSRFLATAFDHGLDDDQEFLDREYDFEIDVYLKDNGDIGYAIISIKVLGWSVRINFTTFE